MILKEVINKKRIKFIKLSLFIFTFLLVGCTLKTAQKSSTNERSHVKATETVNATEVFEDPLSMIEGKWFVVEYLGEEIPPDGAEPVTEEEILAHEKRVSEIKEIYLGNTFEINSENAARFYPPTKFGHNPYTSWDDLFDLYRQPECWEWAQAPFYSINVYYKDTDTYLENIVEYNGKFNSIFYVNENHFNFIVDGIGNVILYVKGSFFRMMDLNQIPENPLSKIEGKWYVAEFLGEFVEYHGAEPTTEEQIDSHEKFVSEEKKKYLGTTIEINKENVFPSRTYAPTELGYWCLDWDDLFMVRYRPSRYIWEEVSFPFFCINLEYKEDGNYLDFLIDNEGITTLWVNGLFFRLEKD